LKVSHSGQAYPLVTAADHSITTLMPLYGIPLNRTEKLDLRLTPAAKDTLRLAAESSRESVSEPATELSADNVSRKLREGGWEWTAFIQGPNETLNQIKCVRYTLHPTFPDPLQDVCFRGSGPQAFPLTATGWGTFELKIQVVFADGRSVDLKHYLKF
jgi:hypothetical protein